MYTSISKTWNISAKNFRFAYKKFH